MLSRVRDVQPKKRRKTNDSSSFNKLKSEGSIAVKSTFPAHERLQCEVERLYSEYTEIANNGMRLAEAQQAYHKYRQARTAYHIRAYNVFGAQCKVETESKAQQETTGQRLRTLSLHQIKQMMCALEKADRPRFRDDKAAQYEREIPSIYASLASDKRHKHDIHTANLFYPFQVHQPSFSNLFVHVAH